MSRILMDPTPDAGGGGTAPAQPAAPAPPAAPTSPAPVPTVHVTPEMWQMLHGELSTLREFKQQQESVLEAERNKSIQAMAEKGKVEEALTQLHDDHKKKLGEAAAKAQQIEAKWLGEKRNAAVADALAGRVFNGTDPNATAALVKRLLTDEIEASIDTQGNPTVHDKVTRRPAPDYLKDRLASPEFLVFFAPGTQGGAGAKGGDRPAPAAAAQTQSLADSLIESHRAKVAAQRRDYHGLTPNSN